MLQQTGTATVIPYFNRFVASFPHVQALAQAPIDAVLAHWQGLGYYRRAHLLHKCAKMIVAQGMPQSYDGWLALPGIGPYTAGAITTIGYNNPAVAVDGNIRRIFSRYFGIQGPHWLKEVSAQAGVQLPNSRFGDYTQALMDLGASVCKTKQPQCNQCPLASSCYAFCRGNLADFPPKIKKVRPKILFAHFLVAHDPIHGLWMCQAKEGDLLPGLWVFPSSPWTPSSGLSPNTLVQGCTYKGQLIHRFTHITLRAHYWVAPDPAAQVPLLCAKGFSGQWIGWQNIDEYPLSTLVRKIILAIFGPRLS
jgi:A/G-specific adenine glycosylase